jgi:hypothetical protein
MPAAKVYLHALILAIELSASPTRKIVCGTHCIEDWVGLKLSGYGIEACPCWVSNPNYLATQHVM